MGGLLKILNEIDVNLERVQGAPHGFEGDAMLGGLNMFWGCPVGK